MLTTQTTGACQRCQFIMTGPIWRPDGLNFPDPADVIFQPPHHTLRAHMYSALHPQPNEAFMNRIAFALIVACSLTFGVNALAGWTRAGADAEAVFRGSGPGGFKIEGKTKTVNITDDGTLMTITVNLVDLATGIGLRDRHMRDKYLEVAKFPDAVLVVSLAGLKIPTDAAVVEADANGMFTLHGVSKELPFHYKGICKADGMCEIDGALNLNMNDFGVKVPSYLGITVKPDLTTSVHFYLKRP